MLHDTLKTATHDVHQRLEATPFSLALRDRKLPSVAVVHLLESFLNVHNVFEQAIFAVKDSRVTAFLKNYKMKVPLLKSDLDQSNAALFSDPNPAKTHELQLINLVEHKTKSPFYLLGVLYVFEGSQNGGMALKRLYAESLGLPVDQLSYFGCYGQQTSLMWKTFVQNLNALNLTTQEASELTEGAVQTFASIDRIFTGLYQN